MYYRGSGPWGAGKGSNLVAAEFDSNTYQLVQMIAAKAPQGVGVAAFNIVGDELYVTLTDHTILGPYPLPVATISFVGPWKPATQYYANQIITANGSTYIVLVNHISAATFDPGANDGAGHNYYGLLLSNPANALPTGGAVGMVLTKATTTDFAVVWVFPTLAGLHDVLPSPAPDAGDLVYWTGSAFSYIDQATVVGPPPTFAFTELTDVLPTPAPTTGQLVYWNGSKFTYINQGSVAAADPFITISPIERGQPLVYNGTEYANSSTVDLPCPITPSNATGNITIDRSTGEVQRLITTGSVTSISFAGWPLAGQFARLVVELNNTGAHTFSWTTSVHAILWAGRIVPTVTVGGTDVYIFWSFDGGTTIYGSVAGQNFG